MKRITIERYKNAEEVGHAGLIEGETDDGRRWIMYLGKDGAPEVYWPERDEDGSVVGEGLPMNKGVWSNVYNHLRVTGEEELISTWPIWNDQAEENQEAGVAGMRGIVFARVPGDGGSREKMKKFLKHLYEGFYEQT